MPPAPPSRFRNLLDLAQLPYFGVRDGRLVLTDRSVGPIIDVHTHLAMAFVRPMQLDLHRGTEETRFYLEKARPIDLDVHMSLNLSPSDLKRTKYDLSLGSLTASGPRATHTLPNLAREMADMGIVKSLLLPIDLLALSDNAGTVLRTIAGRDDFLGYGSVHPYALGVGARLDRQIALGAKGIKVHPTGQLIKPDGRRARRLYRMAAARGLSVFFHCGPVGFEPRLGRWFSQVKHYARPLEENPRTAFVLGHAGSLQMEQALDLSKRYPNAYLDLASQSLPNVRTIVLGADPDRILFGTDWPWYHQAIGLAKVLIATEDRKELRHKILYANAARLLGLDG